MFTFTENKQMNIPLAIRYSPFLILYLILVFLLHDDSFVGDEARYYQFAHNLINGFYSPKPPDINLWSGPGYPIFLIPFVYFSLPLLSITLFNALFQYLSIVLLHLSLTHYVSNKLATAISIFWGMYYISFQEMGGILTESFSLFLITLFLYLLIKAQKDKTLKFTLAGGIALGYLALTKIIFGYVILVMLIGTALTFIIQYMLQSENKKILKLLGVLAIAFSINIPYLIYTYSLTGKYFYWGNSGGSSLYWMSTPYENEYGDWNHSTFTANCHDKSILCNADLVAKNHQKDMDYIQSLPKIEQDDAFKSIAYQNIKEHPFKYVKNIAANISRLFFAMPISYYPQRFLTIFRFPPTILLLTAMTLSLVFWLFNFSRTPTEINFLIFLNFVYLGGTSLLSAYPRMLYVVVPLILFWCAYILNRSIQIKWIWSK